jgi:hypothetical protein
MGAPNRKNGGYFNPGNDTCWPAPDCGDEDLVEVPGHLLRSAWAAYVQLLTHPCGKDMLSSARSGWLRIKEKEEG